MQAGTASGGSTATSQEARDSDGPTGGSESPTGGPTTPAKSAGAAPALNRDLRFWAILLAIGFSGLLSALEATITSTTLPTVIAELGGGDLYIWAVNGYFLAMTSLQPMFGQLVNVFGRRWPTICATAAFVLGSGICGGATGMGTLIAGRVVQGIGAGGINVLVEIIICDLVPLRERGTYFAIIFGLVAIGTALGPFFGGLIVTYPSWRWVFYLHLPVGGFALLLLLVFLNVKHNREKTLATRLTTIDWVGNVIFVLTPLIVGFSGLVGFVIFEASALAPYPTVPLHLLSNRTSAIVFFLTLMHSIVTMWAIYFLPIYFQGVLGSTPSRSGVQLLPTILILIPFAAAGGALMSKLGRYRAIHQAGHALMVLGFGLFTLLDENSNTGTWVGLQIVESAGAGLIAPTLLPAVMAPLAESDTALAAATWAFFRSFGLTWGTAIPAAIFNNRFDQLAETEITDPVLRSRLTGGRAYESATAAFRSTLSEATRNEFTRVLEMSLQRTWQVAIGFAALGFLLVFLEKEVPLRQELETEFGMVDKKDREENVEEAKEVKDPDPQKQNTT
ncbi:Efflux pump FUS6 [Metarhizium brunneum]|uniref:Efflux pump FUS6 n=1 Tax=Metarhizium brunneum TaxID=500148 RepID=A0A7D5UZ53_9HYPO